MVHGIFACDLIVVDVTVFQRTAAGASVSSQTEVNRHVLIDVQDTRVMIYTA